MQATINKLRLKENELIRVESGIDAFYVARLALSLGCVGDYFAQLAAKDYNALVDLHAACVRGIDSDLGGCVVISAAEWCNRFNTFIPGQLVKVCKDGTDQGERIHIRNTLCVDSLFGDAYREGRYYELITWDEIKSPYAPWKPYEGVGDEAEEQITVDDELTEKLRLFPNEWVRCSSKLETVYMVTLADKLGRRWDDGSSYLHRLNLASDSCCYNLYTGVCKNEEDVPTTDASVISATEWLNRHNEFIPGQQVIVWSEDAAMGTRIYLHGFVCVTKDDEEMYRKEGPFETREWNDIAPTTPPWDELRKTVTDKKYTLFGVELSYAQYYALRDEVHKLK